VIFRGEGVGMVKGERCKVKGEGQKAKVKRKKSLRRTLRVPLRLLCIKLSSFLQTLFFASYIFSRFSSRG